MSVSDYSEPGLGSTAVEWHEPDHTSHKDPHHDLLALLPALEQITGEFQGHHGACFAEHAGRFAPSLILKLQNTAKTQGFPK